jgi:hypothetical protein
MQQVPRGALRAAGNRKGKLMQCGAVLVRDGHILARCERNIGNEHFSNDAMHECKTTDADGKSGVLVRWATWRTITAAATPDGRADSAVFTDN